jgi:hypothetical protein
MKKFLMIAAMVAMVAAPAMAGMVPYQGPTNGTVNQLNMADYNVKNVYINPAYGSQGAGNRGLIAAPYAANDPAAVFDNMPVSFGFAGPGTSLWFYGSSFPAGAVYWDDMTPKAGTTSLTEMKWFWGDFGSYTSGTHTQFFQIAGSTVSGDVDLSNIIASFAISGLPALSTFFAAFSLPIDLTAIFGPGGVPAPGGQLWYGWGHFSFVGNPTMFGNGWPTVDGSNAFIQSGGSIGNPTAFYVGNSGLRACLSSGTSLTCFSSVLTFGSIYSMNIAFNGVPEPSVIGLLAIGGLVALRRRKA